MSRLVCSLLALVLVAWKCTAARAEAPAEIASAAVPLLRNRAAILAPYGLAALSTGRVLQLGGRRRVVSLVDGAAESVTSFTFAPEPGVNTSWYRPRISCSGHDVLRETDVSLSTAVTSREKTANFTAVVEFERSVGKAEFSVSFARPDGSVYAIMTVEFLVVGISFFRVDQAGTKELIPPSGIRFSSFVKLPEDLRLVFACKVQFADGSSTFSTVSPAASRLGLPTVTIDPGHGRNMLDGDIRKCAREISKQEGASILRRECPAGFSATSAEVGLRFTVQLRSGSTGRVAVRLRWPALTADVDGEEYETSLVIIVGGESEPIVLALSPPGPFSRHGGERLECVLGNTGPEDKFKLRVKNKTVTSVHEQDHSVQNGTARINFKLPPGKGTAVPWDVLVTAPGRTTRVAQWAGRGERFNLSYRADELWIDGITPRTGSVDGGTAVTLTGQFSKAALTNASAGLVAFGDWGLPVFLIRGVTEKRVDLRTPAWNATGALKLALDVTVRADGEQSNKVKFVYVDQPQVVGMVRWTVGFMIGLLITVLMATCVLCCCGTAILRRRAEDSVGPGEGVAHIDRDQFGRNMDPGALFTPRSYVERIVEGFVRSPENRNPGEDPGGAEEDGDEVVFSAVALDDNDKRESGGH